MYMHIYMSRYQTCYTYCTGVRGEKRTEITSLHCLAASAVVSLNDATFCSPNNANQAANLPAS